MEDEFYHEDGIKWMRTEFIRSSSCLHLVYISSSVLSKIIEVILMHRVIVSFVTHCLFVLHNPGVARRELNFLERPLHSEPS